MLGGALFTASGSATLSGCTLTANTAIGGDGGGLGGESGRGGGINGGLAGGSGAQGANGGYAGGGGGGGTCYLASPPENIPVAAEATEGLAAAVPAPAVAALGVGVAGQGGLGAGRGEDRPLPVRRRRRRWCRAGGVFADSGTVTVLGCSFLGNQAQGGTGGTGRGSRGGNLVAGINTLANNAVTLNGSGATLTVHVDGLTATGTPKRSASPIA